MRLISSILFIVVAVLLFFFVTDPLYNDVKQLRADVSTYNIALNNSTELQRTRDTLINTYKDIKIEDKDRLTHFLPSTIGNIELILEIEKIANVYGMPLRDIKFELKSMEKDTTNKDSLVVAESNPADYLPYSIFPMEFIIEGRYDTFVSFLKDLEDNLRLVDIRAVSFDVPLPVTNPGDTTDSSIYSYTLKVETYWLK